MLNVVDNEKSFLLHAIQLISTVKEKREFEMRTNKEKNIASKDHVIKITLLC